MRSVILFLKSHVAGYMRDGKYVKPYQRRGGPAVSPGDGQLALFTSPAVEPAKIEKPPTGPQQARQAKYSTKTGPTSDEAADPRRKYYVTMARDGVGVARLAGPFDTHNEALAHVDRAREEAEKADPRASFDSFGTAGVESDNHKPGVLNARLGIGASADPGPAANGSKFGTLFHGSAKPFEKYDMSRSGKGGGYRHQGDAVYLTSDQKGYARYFAGTSASKESFRGSYGGTMSKKEADEMDRSEGAVMPATLDPSAKILDMRSGKVPDDVRKLFDTSVGDPEIAKRLSKRVRDLGYDGIAFIEPNAPEGWELQHDATTVAVYNPDKVRFHADKAVRGADLQAATAPVTVASRKRIRDPLEGSHTELTLSNGKVARIQRMSSGSTMGLAGWHDLDGGQYSYLDDTEEGAIKELLRRHGAAVSVAKPELTHSGRS